MCRESDCFTGGSRHNFLRVSAILRLEVCRIVFTDLRVRSVVVGNPRLIAVVMTDCLLSLTVIVISAGLTCMAGKAARRTGRCGDGISI